MSLKMKVTSMQQRLDAREMSLDAPISADDERQSRMDLVRSASVSPEREVGDEQFHTLLREKITIFGESLKGRDREVFSLRTTAEEPLTLQEIGDRYGITRERARQIEARILNKLRSYLRTELGDAVDVALQGMDTE